MASLAYRTTSKLYSVSQKTHRRTRMPHNSDTQAYEYNETGIILHYCASCFVVYVYVRWCRLDITSSYIIYVLYSCIFVCYLRRKNIIYKSLLDTRT